MAGEDDDKKNTRSKGKRERADSSGSDASADTGPKDKETRMSYDEARRKEIRETNRLAARECRARKKRLMSELEKTVSSLTAEHSALMKQNRELTIRLETLQRVHPVALGMVPGAVPGPCTNAIPTIQGIQGMAGIPGQHVVLGGAGGSQMGLFPNFQVR